MPLLPRFEAAMQKLEDEQKIAKLVQESGDPVRVRAGSTSGGEPRRLRGIPAVSKVGVGGAIFGTSPVAALLAKEGRRRP